MKPEIRGNQTIGKRKELAREKTIDEGKEKAGKIDLGAKRESECWQKLVGQGNRHITVQKHTNKKCQHSKAKIRE